MQVERIYFYSKYESMIGCFKKIVTAKVAVTILKFKIGFLLLKKRICCAIACGNLEAGAAA